MPETPRAEPTSFDTQREAAACASPQGRDTTIYTYDADRLVAMLCPEPASITLYHYDACDDLFEGAAGSTSDDVPNTAGD